MNIQPGQVYERSPTQKSKGNVPEKTGVTFVIVNTNSIEGTGKHVVAIKYLTHLNEKVVGMIFYVMPEFIERCCSYVGENP